MSNKKIIIAAVAAGVLWYLFKNTPTAEAAGLPSLGSAYNAAPQFNPDYSSTAAPQTATSAPVPTAKPFNFFSGYSIGPVNSSGRKGGGGYKTVLE